MNCADFEKLIALDVEGDLPKQMAGGVTAHLGTCRQCQEFAEKLQATQALLKELGQEAPDEAILQEVRRGILNRLPSEAEPKAFPVWVYALGAGLVAILILAAVVLRHPPRTPVTQVIAKRQIPTTTEAVRQTPTLPPRSPVHHAKNAQAVKTSNYLSGSLRASANWQHPEPLTVKLMTDNPNVVIYWQID